MKYKIFFLSIAISLFSLFVSHGYFDRFEEIFHDAFFKKKYYGKVREGSEDKVVVVDIDGRSANKLGRFQNWDRAYYAKMLNVLKDIKSSVVAFDILLPESKFLKEDSILADALHHNGKALLGYSFDVVDSSSFIYPDSINNSFITKRSFKDNGFNVPVRSIIDLGNTQLHISANGSGHINMVHSPDGVIRKASMFFKYQGKLYPSLAFLATQKHLNVYNSDVVFENGRKIELKNAELPLVLNLQIDNSGSNPGIFEQISRFIFSKEISEKSELKLIGVEVDEKKQCFKVPYINLNNITEKKFKNKMFLAIVNSDDEVELLITEKYKRDNDKEFYLINFRDLGVRKHRIKSNKEENIYRIKNVNIGKIVKDISIPLNEKNEMRIHYKGTWKTFRTVSFCDVFSGDIGKKTFKDNVVLVGASLRGLMDLRSTPIQENFPGVEVHANIINTILTEDFINNLSMFENILILIAFILLTCLLFISSINTLITFVITFFVSLGYYYFSYYMFAKYNYLLNVFRPLSVIFFTTIVTYAVKYLDEVKNKLFIKNTLGKYVPEVVSNAMLKDSTLLKVGGERKNITMMFTDIRSFTSISEQIDAQSLIKFLNHYLMEMTKIIKMNQGTLDKFIGDCIVCLFGAPLENNHPYNACLSALKMSKRLEEIKPEFDHDLLKTIETGLGINTGEVTVGNIGSDDLFDYTAIGDHMNLASRLEGLNKYYGTKILISEYTYENVKEDFIFRLIDDVVVKGRKRPVKIYELVEEKAIGISPEKEKVLNIYQEAFLKYKFGHFFEAIILLESALKIDLNDGPSYLLKKRCEQLKENPIDEWNGIWIMKDK